MRSSGNVGDRHALDGRDSLRNVNDVARLTAALDSFTHHEALSLP